MDLKCVPDTWFSSMVETSIKSTNKRHGVGEQWPPEQWLWSALFETYPKIVRKLNSSFHRHCSEVGSGRNNNTFNNATLYIHWCGDRNPLHLAPWGPTLKVVCVCVCVCVVLCVCVCVCVLCAVLCVVFVCKRARDRKEREKRERERKEGERERKEREHRHTHTHTHTHTPHEPAANTLNLV